MKVFVTGGTGNLGSRVIPAAVNHNHKVVAYVRNKAKLEQMLPADVVSKITVVEGSLTDEARMIEAMKGCDAAINTAGLAAPAPWSTNEFPILFKAFVDAAGRGLQGPKRVWALGGLSALSFSEKPDAPLLVSYFPVYKVHGENLAYLKTRGTEMGLDWSFLCPSLMTAAKGAPEELIAGATAPPLWKTNALSKLPIVGPIFEVLPNALRYNITLEAAAEFIVTQLDKSEFSGKKVGLIAAPHKKAT